MPSPFHAPPYVPLQSTGKQNITIPSEVSELLIRVSNGGDGVGDDDDSDDSVITVDRYYMYRTYVSVAIVALRCRNDRLHRSIFSYRRIVFHTGIDFITVY